MQLNLPSLPKIKCKVVQKKVLRHGHLALHTIYWVHGIAEHPTIFVVLLYGAICGLTLVTELVFHTEANSATVEAEETSL